MGYITVIIITASVSLSGQTWCQRAPIPTPRWYPASAVLEGWIYVLGGQDSIPPYSSTGIVEAYDPATDTWETKTSGMLPI
jgi:hypothetical protein